MRPDDVARVRWLVPLVAIVRSVGLISTCGSCIVRDSSSSCSLSVDVTLVRTNLRHRSVLASRSMTVHLLLIYKFHLLVTLSTDLIHGYVLTNVFLTRILRVLVMGFWLLAALFLWLLSLSLLLLLLGWSHRHGWKMHRLALICHVASSSRLHGPLVS